MLRNLGIFTVSLTSLAAVEFGITTYRANELQKKQARIDKEDHLADYCHSTNNETPKPGR